MKTSKFLVSAAAIVATAGAIGAAIAQTVVPTTPTTDPSVNVGSQGSPQATIDKGPAASTGANSDAAGGSSSTLSTDNSAPMAQADRN